MMSFADKVKDARAARGLTQPQLSEMVGISVRSIVAYESGEKVPRQGTMLKLAKALQVSVKFLSDVNCTNPVEDIEKDGYIEEARELYGARGGYDMDTLLEQNRALFAGGELSQDQKDAYFSALMEAYVLAKEGAKAKFGRKNNGDK